MERINELTEPGMIPVGSIMSSTLLAWVENPWRRHMLPIHLNLVATGSVGPSRARQYVSGLSALAETHNIESALDLLPCVMYVPRIYAREDIDQTQNARGLEWFTEEQVAMSKPSLFASGLTMPVVSSSFIMQAGAAATVLAEEVPKDNRWHVIQGPYGLFPLPNIRMRNINDDWGMISMLVPGAHVVAPVNLLQLARKVSGPLPFRLTYASSARMLIGNFDAWYNRARKTGVLVSIHRLHPRDIEILVQNEKEACARTSDPVKGRWLGPFDHFAAKEIAELLLSSGVRTGMRDKLYKSDSWLRALHGALASMRHQMLTEWCNSFNCSWMGGVEFELNPMAIKMGKVIDSLGQLGCERVKLGQHPSFWLEQLEQCTGSFAELQLWYGQLSDSTQYQKEAELASEIGPYPVGRFVSEWGLLPGLKTWLGDGEGEIVELDSLERYEMKIFSNRAYKKVFCASRVDDKSEQSSAASRVVFTFLEWLRTAEAIFEVGCETGRPTFRRRGGSWQTFKSREELRDKLHAIDISSFLARAYENSLIPPQWTPELQAALIEILGLSLCHWSAPYAPLCVHQFIHAIRETLGFRVLENWQETMEVTVHLAGAELDYLVDIWWPEAFAVYRTDMSWVLEIDHGIGLTINAKDGDNRIHVPRGFEIVRYACGFPKKISWRRHEGGIVVGTDALESLFTAPTSTVALRLSRPHCAAEAWAASDLKDVLAQALGIRFEIRVDGTMPMIELRGAKRRLKTLLRLIPGFFAGGVVGYTPPPALLNEERRSGGCWIWTQAQLRGLAGEHCAELHERIGVPWDGQTHVLARACADAVVLWGVVEHGLRCCVTAGGEWLPEGRRAENGFCWDQPLELGPVVGVFHAGSDVSVLATSDKAVLWRSCVVSRGDGKNCGGRARIIPEGSAEIVAVGSGEKPDGAFQRPLVRVQVG